MKRGLFFKYVTAFVGLVTVVLVINAALDLWFVYQDNRRASIDVQREKAEAAAQKVESFVREIERQIGWVAYPQWAALPVEQRRFEYVRLQRQVPAITELTQLDRRGHEQLKVSRLSMDVVGGDVDRSTDPAFTEAIANKVYFGPVYYRKESEPYLSMAVAHGGRAGGVTVAEINLKLILDVITQIKIGLNGYAYVVDTQGRLIAHPDISLVLRGTDMNRLPQVAQARAPEAAAEPTAQTRDLAGRSVLSAHAEIPALKWLVFVDLPSAEALQPVYDTGLRDLALLVLGLLIAGAVAALLARRMVVPIRTLQAGAARIGSGELDHRLSIKTGDELEALADQFNRSAEALQESHATLEQRVVDRTRELTETLEQQTATADILRVISESPTDVLPVFDAIVSCAARLSDSKHCVLYTYDGEQQHFAAAFGGTDVVAVSKVRALYPQPPNPLAATGRAILEREVVHVPDLQHDGRFNRSVTATEGYGALLVVPMTREDKPIGAILVVRAEIGPFSNKQVELLQTFAAQAVIAIENVRLFTELRESLEQQTASAEILQVISQSPTDVQPVLDAVARAAVRFCGAPDAAIVLRDGDDSVMRSHHGSLPATIGFRRPITTGASGEAIREARTVQYPDTSLLDPMEHASTLDRAKEYGFRATIAAPLLIEGAAIGAIVLRKPDPGALAPRQVELLETFAAQAVIAIQNVRLFTELRDSLEQQTATGEILEVISQSPTDVMPVLKAVTAAARRFCGAEDAGDAGITLREGSDLVVAAADGTMLTVDIGRRDPLDRASIRGRSIIDGVTIHVPDMLALDDAEYGRARKQAMELNFRALLCAPMLRDGGAIGCITLRNPKPGNFTQRQIELLESFAAQAVIAIQNVRLFTELRDSLEQQTATAEILHVISQSPTDVQPVLKAVVAAARRFCGADDALIVLRDGAEAEVVAHAGSLTSPDRLRVPIDTTNIACHAIVDGLTIHAPDVAGLDSERYGHSQALAREHKYSAALAAPMLREGVAIGSITLRKPASGDFTPRQIALLEAFAAQAVIAIENVRLFTEIQEKSRQLEVASQHKSQFLANMSHELRTPLNAILGYTEMMVDGLYGALPQKATGVLDRVQSNGRHLLGLINDVLDLAKIEAGQLAIAIEPYVVTDMVTTVLSATESLARTKGIGLSSTVAPGLPSGTGDARRLTQVLLNLVGNAIKFTDQGSVEVRAAQVGDKFELSVVDTGFGIAPEDQKKIFEEFQQVDNTSTRKKGGTGLGLSISRKIVELHGGAITVESEIGKGSIFKVSIPIHVAATKEAAQ